MGNMEIAVKAALNGPEVKKINIYDHEFNVKPVEISRDGQRIIINGQISHHLSFRPDDQVYYTVTKENDAIKDTQVKINRGGFAPLAAPIVSGLTAYAGRPIPPDKVEEVGRHLGTLIDGSWEQSAQVIIANVAMRVH